MAAKTRYKKWAVKIQHCPISSKFDMWLDNDVPNWLPTLNIFSRSPFQNGHHNTAKIQHCPISKKFDMWVDNDVPNWLPTLKISTGRHFQNGRHNTANIQHCPISLKFDMWVDNDVPTLKIFYRSPFSKWPPQYRTNSTLSDFNAISYVGRLWCPDLIPDIEKFLPGAIFKMATTIPHKFNIVRFQRHFICG